MAKMGYIENPARKRRRRRRNPVAATTKRVTKRNGTTLIQAKAAAKRNGLKLVSLKSASNPRKRRHHKRRNPATVTARRKNGLLGNTKHDAMQVGSLLAGMAATKIGGRVVSGFLGSIAASVGMGDYAELAADVLVALFVAPMVGGFIDKSAGKQNARLGGLAVVGLEVLNKFAPSAFNTLNPFASSSPVVLNGSQALLTPPAVAAIVANSGAPPAAVAKVAGAMQALQNGARMRMPGPPQRPLFN